MQFTEEEISRLDEYAHGEGIPYVVCAGLRLYTFQEVMAKFSLESGQVVSETVGREVYKANLDKIRQEA